LYPVSPSLMTVVAVTPSPGMLFGLMLLAALLGGYAAHFCRVPRVVGFFLAGVALRGVIYSVFVLEDGVATADALDAAAEPLTAIKDLALGLILFSIGGVFERAQVRAAGNRVLKISLLDVGCSAGFVLAGCLCAALIVQPRYGFADNLLLAVLLGIAAIATAPAATLFVLHEHDARGPITNTILATTGLNNIVCIVLFYSVFLILASAGAIRTSGGLSGHLLWMLGLATIGSVLLGVACGALLAVAHGKLVFGEMLIAFFTLFVLLGSGEKWLVAHGGMSYNFLLTSLVIGAVFANVAIDAPKLASSLRTIASPIFAGFFVMAGYGLHVSELWSLGWVGAVYVVCRLIGKSAGGALGVRWARAPQGAGGRLGTALLCQAAVVIGLAAFVESNWDSDLARQFSTIVLGSVVVFELIGPLLLKRCIVQGGEVKAVTLLRRTDRAGQGASIVTLTGEALVRLLGRPARTRRGDRGPMLVGHIMRGNVQFIPAAGTLDEVLHFIERSTHSEFPVVDERGRFVGTIHFHDIRDVIYDPSMRELVTAVDLADAEATAVPRTMQLIDLLEVFTTRNVSLLPVVDHADSNRVVGVVEQRDLLRALHRFHETS